MEKRKYFDGNGIFYENEEYLMKALSEEDKENYLALYKENSKLANAPAKFDFAGFMEDMWNHLSDEDGINISIYRKDDGAYIGNVSIKDLQSKTPELGIEIVGIYRRHGHAFRVINYTKTRLQVLCEIDYLLIRIYSDNEPSQKLFQKLGVVEIGREENEYAGLLRKLKESKFQELYAEKAECLQALINKNYIGRYKLL